MIIRLYESNMYCFSLGNQPEVLDVNDQESNSVLRCGDMRRSRRKKKFTEKGSEYQMSILEERRASLTVKLLRKSSIIEELLYSDKNCQTVRKELALLDGLFKLLCAVHEFICRFNQSQEEDWFTNIDKIL